MVVHMKFTDACEVLTFEVARHLRDKAEETPCLIINKLRSIVVVEVDLACKPCKVVAIDDGKDAFAAALLDSNGFKLRAVLYDFLVEGLGTNL